MSEAKQPPCRIIRNAHDYRNCAVALVYCPKCGGEHVLHYGVPVRLDPGVRTFGKARQEAQS